MRFGADPFLPLWLLIPALLLYAAAMFWFYWRWRRVVSRSYWTALVVAKLVFGLVLVVLLLNPYHIQRTPDTRKYAVVVLTDATQSMATTDCDGRSRIDVVRDDILAKDSPFATQVLRKYANTRFYIFAGDRLRRVDQDTEFDVLTGNTDIDPILRQAFRTGSGQHTLGAVLLLTDGGDNQGVSLLEGAAPYRKIGVPIHVIGVGDRRAKPDLGVLWTETPKRCVKGKPFRLKATVSRLSTNVAETDVILHDGNREIARQTVYFEGTDDQVVEFKVVPFLAGFKTYRVVVPALAEEQNTLNNVDYFGVEVREPDIFKVFYFSGNLDWNYKFLKILADRQERLQLDAVIRTGPKAWFNHGITREKEKTGFPVSQLGDYDCMVIDLSALPLLNEADTEALIKFIENRGGGVIFSGVTTSLPENILRILPVKLDALRVTRLGKSSLKFPQTRILGREDPEDLEDLSKYLFVPAEAGLLEIRETDVKPGARAAALVQGADFVGLAAHNYGAGKVALLNLADTWNWSMQSDLSGDYYDLFWGRLITWAASGSKPRIVLKPHGAKLPLGEEQELTLDLLDRSFRSSNDAKVTALLKLPNGDEQDLVFAASSRVDGRYAARFIPHQPGEYGIKVFATMADGEVQEAAMNYLVVSSSAETQPRPLAEAQLQSLARLTDGSYWNYKDIGKAKELPLTKALQFVESRHDLRRLWIFLIVVIGCLLPDWFLRRRIGLR